VRAFLFFLVATAACGVPSTGSVATARRLERPRICAHRGASIEAPENTHAAFRRAWQLGAECVELDVRLSVDGAVVVFHDATTARIGGVDRPVAAQTLAELRQLDVGAGERMPLLAEVLAEAPAGATVFVELKSEAATAPAVAAVIRAAAVEARGAHVALQGYDAASLAALAGLLPGAPAYWDVDPPVVDGQPTRYPAALVDAMIAEATSRGFAGLALDVRGVDPALVARVRAAGLELDVWTLNDAALIAAWQAQPVRWIETDAPALAPVSAP